MSHKKQPNPTIATILKRKKRNAIFMHPKRNKNLNEQNRRLAIVFICLMSVILLLPTIVVTITQSKEQPQQTKAIEKAAIETTPIDTQVVVPVARTAEERVDEIPLEQYVAAVVASEMPAQFELEALKAQAVAARTYVIQHLLQKEDHPITDSVMHQVYRDEKEMREIFGKDYDWIMEKVQKATEETKNEIITFNNKPITPTFFSMSNGFTEDAKNYWGKEFPYLKSVESRWEESHPKFIDQEIFTLHEVAEKLNISLDKGQHLNMKITRNDTNRVRTFEIAGTTFTGKEVREKLGLRSHDFTVEQRGEHLIFKTKGYGHGVGMGQYGANGMAKEGKRYDEILQYYYQGIELSTIDEMTPALVAK